jgi:hypothetical protein
LRIPPAARAAAGTAFAGALALAALASPAAHAARRMEVALMDDQVFVERAYYDRERALTQAHDLDVTRIRANVTWTDANRSQVNRTKRPRKIRYDWAKWDSLIDAAARHGIRVQLTLTGPGPAYAMIDHRPGVFGPSASAFASFVRAAVRHFKGRVDRYAIWNEPNHISWLQPFDLDAAIYRDLYRAAYAAAKSQDRHAKVLIGELVPYGSGAAYAPIRFLRAVTCTSLLRRATPSRPPLLRRDPCRALRADGIAQHPYDYKKGTRSLDIDEDSATVDRLWQLSGMLRSLSHTGALTTPGGHTLPIYLTEFGYFHTGGYRISEKRRAKLLPRGFALAQRDPLVREMTQYTFVTPPYGLLGSFFDLSILDLAGHPLPPYESLRSWVKKAARSGRVRRPGGPIKLPPARRK